MKRLRNRGFRDTPWHLSSNMRAGWENKRGRRYLTTDGLYTPLVLRPKGGAV